MMRIEVAYALPDRQIIVPLEVEQGITISQAIERSGILDRFPEIDLTENKVGVFGKLGKLEDSLADGDRIEIYRKLVADPKQARRQRAEKEHNA
jgi:hypothetical protein